MENLDNLSLVFVNPIGQNSEGLYEYEFFFSDTPEIVWGEDWNIPSPSACGNILPDENTYSVVKRLITDMELFCAQQNSCFSMQDCIDGCIALIFFYNENVDKYIPIQFGVNYSLLNEIFLKNNCIFYWH